MSGNLGGRRGMAMGKLPKQTRREDQGGQWAQQGSADLQKILPANPKQPNRKDDLSQWEKDSEQALSYPSEEEWMVQIKYNYYS